MRASAAGPGNLVVLFGATTGRDGIGGASVLASQDLDESDEDKRPSVQVGDPFTGKKLIECTLELAAARPRRLGAGPGRGGSRVVDLRDGGERRRRHRAGARARAAARAGHAAVRDHDLGVAGAHGSDRRAGAPGRGRGGVRALAAPVHGDRPRHRRRSPALPLGGRGRRRHARRGARRRTALSAARPAPRAARRAVAPAEDVPRGRGSEGSPAAPAGRAEHLRQDVGLRAVRPGRRLGHGRCARAATRAWCG